MTDRNRQLPSRLSDVFRKLSDDVAWLHARWIICGQLFARSAKRVDLLSECADVCLAVIQHVLRDAIELSLSKLTDPPKGMGRERLSMGLLLERVKELEERRRSGELVERLQQLLDALRQKCATVRKRRNRELVHRDLQTALREHVKPLPPASWQAIGEALRLVRAFMNEIEVHYTGNECAYEHFRMMGDGDALVAALKDAARYRELLEEEKIPPWDSGPQRYQDA
jgi:hypothetical protein